MMKRILTTIAYIFITFAAVFADEVSFVVSAPGEVVVDNHFRVTYTINRGNVKEPRIPQFEGFELLSGPNRSTSSSYKNMNGQVTTSYNVTFTYILMPVKEGKFKIPAATIEADGKQYKSNSTEITVLPADKTARSSSGGQKTENRNGSASISNDELFMRATLNKTTVYEQEAVLLTYKIYSLVNLTNLSGKMPDLKGFQIQEVELPQNKEWSLEHYNGRNYRVITWSQYVLFPQQSGKIEIPSVDFDGTVVVRNSSAAMDPFDFFMNGGSRMMEVKKRLRTPRLELNVEALPAGKPADFSGAVGQFNMTSSISTTELEANEAVTLRVNISGTGNMKLIKTPEVYFPEDFEIYDPKVDNRIKLTTAGFNGNKIIEYLAIPRHGGEYTIPAVNFSYFDTQSKQYRTISTEPYTIKVAKGKGSSTAGVASFVSKEELKMLGQDIRYIKNSNVTLHKRGCYLFASPMWIIYYIVPLLLFVAYILLRYKQIKENANIAKIRTKKANKVAVKRLKVANKLFNENKRNEFYDEILRTLWGYLGDKLSIPVASLNKDNIAARLAEKGVGEELIKELDNLLNECEYARYAPGDAGEAMDKVYKMTMKVISNMENTIKR